MAIVAGATGLYVDGVWRESSERLAVTHKFTGAVLAEVAVAGPSEVDEAVAAARRAAARSLPPLERAAILRRAAEAIASRAGDLALLIAREGGKPLKDARAEVARAVQTFTLSADQATRVHGEQVPVDASPGNADRLAFTLRVPVGVVAAIAPFNFPLNLVAHKVAPALAAGNAVVCKPASTTPLTAVELCRILEACGLPPGFLNLVVGPGGTTGEALLAHPGVDLYSFTGSPDVGRRVKERTGLRRVVLELGNSSPNIVCADADLDRAADLLARRAYGSAGQTCISVQRIYVEAGAFEALRQRLVATAASLVVGDPEDERTDVGPMITEAEAARAESWVEEAVAGGARRAFGGGRQGAVMPPVLLTDVQPEMAVVCREVFAPVASLVAVDSFDEAVEQANATPYGLQAGVFTSSVARALDAARRLHFGGVIVNDTSSFRADLMPYGGVKGSGMGREGPRYAVEEMTELRTVVMRG
jgi:acyl-CoA reductase-like NAD-dependent aldehyde dehydrogenase